MFQFKPMIAFKRSKNVQEIAGGHTFKQGKVFKFFFLDKQNRKYTSCSLTRPSLCCLQIVTTQAKRTFNIFHKLTSNSQYVSYLMEWILCKKSPFNLRLHHYREDVNNSKAIPLCNHFKIYVYNFMFTSSL